MDLISITPTARHKLLELKGEQNNASEAFLRIGSRGGGCGVSVSYFLGFDQAGADDKVMTIDGIECVVQKGQLLQLQGLMVDWVEMGTQQGFLFVESALPAVKSVSVQ